MLNEIVASVNEVLWGKGQVLIYMLLFAGVWFSFKLEFIQIRHFGHMFGLLKGSTEADKSGISSFQALCTSLSARVGTGNLAGVAIAISLGGAGAIFWMWVIAFTIASGTWAYAGLNAVVHAVLLAAIAITVAVFETAKRKPQLFNKYNYNSRGQGGEHE